MAAPKRRADILLHERGLAPSRSRAQALILAGRVYAGHARVDKSGALLASDIDLSVRQTQRFVSRGGDKLQGALLELGLNVAGLVCADLGASTGGFTDCLLQAGASRVFAVDVGHGQLAHSVRTDPRVAVLERTNARHLTPDHLGTRVQLVVVDASFISVKVLLPAITAILQPAGRLLALIKPQFEAGRQEASRGRGVIADPKVRTAAILAVRQGIEACGMRIEAACDCRIRGPKGNLEHFVLAQSPPKHG